MLARYVIHVPDVLGGSPQAAENFIQSIATTEPGGRVTLDMTMVTWICPYGAVMLLSACRYLAQLTRLPVRLIGMRSNVHAYLRRVNFFEYSPAVVNTSEHFDERYDWSRNIASSNLLEITKITCESDINIIANRARKILSYWLSKPLGSTNRIISLISESCSNIVDHSYDNGGVVIIQKYYIVTHTTIELAISDMGIGIRRSLLKAYGGIIDTPTGYIEQAMNGLSSRGPDRIGQGLGRLEKIAAESGGQLFIRSERGSVLAEGAGRVKDDGLPFLPGTQLAIAFCSPN